jgi:hypothetical protein
MFKEITFSTDVEPTEKAAVFGDGVQIGTIRFGDKEGRVLVFRTKQYPQGTSLTRMPEEQQLDFTAEQLERIASELKRLK